MIQHLTHNGVYDFEYVRDGDNDDGQKHKYTCSGKVTVKEKRGITRETQDILL